MKKKIIAISLLSGILGFSSLATAAWESSWSGQVRVNMVESSANASNDNGGVNGVKKDKKPQSDKAWSTSTGADDTFIQWNHTDSDLGVKAFLRFQGNEEVRQSITYNKETDGWTVTAKAEWDTLGFGSDDSAIVERDQYIKAQMANGVSLKLGRSILFDNGYMITGSGVNTGGEAAFDDMYDNPGAYRVNHFAAGYNANGVDVMFAIHLNSEKVGTADTNDTTSGTQQANPTTGDGFDGLSSISTDGTSSVNRSKDVLYDKSGITLAVKYSGVENLQANFLYSNGGATASKERLLNAGFTTTNRGADTKITGTDAKSDLSSSLMGLGVSYDVGVAKPFFSTYTLTKSREDSVTTANAKYSSKQETKTSATVFGADVSLGDDTISIASYSIKDTTETYEVNGDDNMKQDETTKTYLDLAYTTSLGGVATTVSYTQGKNTVETAAGDSTDTDANSLGFRMQYSF